MPVAGWITCLMTGYGRVMTCSVPLECGLPGIRLRHVADVLHRAGIFTKNPVFSMDTPETG